MHSLPPNDRRTKLCARRETIAFTHSKVAADRRPALVDPAQHRASIERRAPAVVETLHDAPAPAIDFGQAVRDIILTHQHNFGLAAASPA